MTNCVLCFFVIVPWAGLLGFIGGIFWLYPLLNGVMLLTYLKAQIKHLFKPRLDESGIYSFHNNVGIFPLYISPFVIQCSSINRIKQLHQIVLEINDKYYIFIHSA